jgi:hypothetical protein
MNLMAKRYALCLAKTPSGFKKSTSYGKAA